MPSVERSGSGWHEDVLAGQADEDWQGKAPYSAQPLSLWRESLVAEFITPYVGGDVTALEVGPGMGDWTERVVGSVQSLMVADRRADTLEGIRDRFGPRTDLREVRIVNDRLTDVPDDSVNLAYSLDFFPFVNRAVLDQWLGELSRVLRPGGYLVVHHAATPRRLRTVVPRRTGLRAKRSVTSGPVDRGASSREVGGGSAASFTASSLVTTRQTSSWGPSGEYTVDKFRDVITIARKPTSRSV